jgi:peroxiredoxin
MNLLENHTPIDCHAPDFELPGIDDLVHHLSRYREDFRAIAAVFMCNHCPYVRGYIDRLKQIQAEFQEQGFVLIGINSNDTQTYPEDSFEKMKVFAEQHQINFPYLWDSTQDVAYSFGAQRTPEAFLIDQSGILRYSGAIDDNPQKPEAVQVQYLRQAIAQMLRGERVSIPTTSAIGCSVKWRN